MAEVVIRTIASVWFIMLGTGTSMTDTLLVCPNQATARMVAARVALSDIYR